MSTGKKFVGMPKHPLDFKHQKRVAKKLDSLLNGKLIDGKGNPIGKIHYADGNTIFEISGGTTTTSNSSFRGIWVANPLSPYMTGDEVVVGAGTSAGIYVSMIDNNTNAPDSGIGWIQSQSFSTWL